MIVRFKQDSLDDFAIPRLLNNDIAYMSSFVKIPEMVSPNYDATFSTPEFSLNVDANVEYRIFYVLEGKFFLLHPNDPFLGFNDVSQHDGL